MRKQLFQLMVLAALFIGFGCGGTTSADGTKRPQRSSRIILAEEFSSSPTVTPNQSLYDAIKYLRPNFLVERAVGGTTSSNRLPAVFVNNVNRGEIEMLTTLSVSEVSKVQYLSASEATFKFGTNYPSGAILVTTK